MRCPSFTSFENTVDLTSFKRVRVGWHLFVWIFTTLLFRSLPFISRQFRCLSDSQGMRQFPSSRRLNQFNLGRVWTEINWNTSRIFVDCYNTELWIVYNGYQLHSWIQNYPRTILWRTTLDLPVQNFLKYENSVLRYVILRIGPQPTLHSFVFAGSVAFAWLVTSRLFIASFLRALRGTGKRNTHLGLHPTWSPWHHFQHGRHYVTSNTAPATSHPTWPPWSHIQYGV